jgi:hypothetical protein
MLLRVTRVRTPLELGATAAYHLEHWFISPIVMITRFHLDGQVVVVFGVGFGTE